MLAPGLLLQDRYEIVAPIAQGGMGAVYQAIDQRLGHTVAIKEIIRSDRMLRAAFEQEARLLAALRHPNLPAVTDHFIEPSGQFLVMEYIPGDDLATLALRQQEPLPVNEVLRWADQLLDLLTYLHSQNPPVIHRDIKPHNLKLNAQGGVILLDFGLAKGAPGQTSNGRSLAGYTLHYAAPEQLRGEQSDATSDLYALAATLYDLLVGTKPPDALQRLATLAAGQPDPLKALHLLNPAVSPAVAAVIQQAMALAPQARFAGAGAMRLALHSAAGEATQIVARPEGGAGIPPTHNLPAQLTSFVARETEIAALQELLLKEDTRLITLTGPGGIGKTRLALAVATRALAHFRDGVFFVSLAPISERTLLLPTIAQTLGQREAANISVRQSLHSYLHDREILLLLDNFEQIVAAAPEVSDLLANAPRLKILITSREALQVRGEQEFPVPALDLPDLRKPPAPDELAHYAAIRLFVQRAKAVKPDFALHEGNAAAIAEICRRLDGLPLAIELAAASTKLLPVQAILTRLAERLDLPARGQRDLPDRQRTLHASIAWSYDLLTDEEKMLFRRLCIFSGSFALEAAEKVCAMTGIDADYVLEMVASLVSKSLVKPLEAGAPEVGEYEARFTLLETIREFGLKRLNGASDGAGSEMEAVAAAHAAYYDQLVQQAERHIWGAAMAEWVSRLEAELENLRAALTYFLAHPQGAEAGLRFAGSLWRFWEIRGHIQEGRAWLDRALQRRDEVPPYSRWLPLHGAGNLAVDQGDYAIANSHYMESLRLLQELLPTLQEQGQIFQTRYAIGNTYLNLGNAALHQGQWQEALTYTEEARSIHHQLVQEQGSRQVGLALTITNLGMIHLLRSNLEQAEAYSLESLALYRQLGDERGIGWNLQRLGAIASMRGDFAQAAAFYQEAKALFEKLSDQADMTTLYVDLGELAEQQGDDQAAEQAYQTGLALSQTIGDRKQVATLLDHLSSLARRRGNYAEAAALSEQSLPIHRQLDNLFGLSDALHNRGEIALAQEDFCAAAADFRESLQLKARVGERRGMIALFKAFASLTMAENGMPENGMPERDTAGRAARLMAAAETLRQTTGVSIPPVDRVADQARLEAVRAALGEADFAAAWHEGAAMHLDEAIAYALASVN